MSNNNNESINKFVRIASERLDTLKALITPPNHLDDLDNEDISLAIDDVIAPLNCLAELLKQDEL